MIVRNWCRAILSTKQSLHTSLFYPYLPIYKPALLQATIPPIKNSIHSFADKRLITISSGGFLGFYMSGVCKYIKTHYQLDNVVFSGASAGSWISLILTYKGDPGDIYGMLLSSNVFGATSISHVEDLIKECLLTHYSTEDFELDRLYIGVTIFQNWGFENVVYSNFDSLTDAINCCIASSHIPFVTGGSTYTYRNALSFDGGFSKYPYLKTITPTFHITPEIWNKNKKDAWKLENFTTLFSRDKYDFIKNLDAGYHDTLENKHIIDLLFTSKNKDGDSGVATKPNHQTPLEYN